MSFGGRQLAREPFGVACGVLVAGGVYAWLARFGIDLTDEGYFMDLATRVMHGQLPYRDFDTYYTPAMFYLDAAAFSALGVSVPAARWLMIAVRLACALVLYRLSRRVSPLPFAMLPPVLLLAADLSVESHPAWPALLGTLVMLEMLAAHSERPPGREGKTRGRRLRSGTWLFLAGASAAMAFAFKQNVGAFAILGGIGYVAFRSRARSGQLTVLLRMAFVASVTVAARGLLASRFDEPLGVTLWLPIVATLLLLLTWPGGSIQTTPDVSPMAGLDGVAFDAAWFGTALTICTLAWAGPLVMALGPAQTPWGLFLGNVNQGALNFPLDSWPIGTRVLAYTALLLPLVLAALFGRHVRWLAAPLAAALAVLLLLLPLLPIRDAALDPLTTHARDFPRLEWLDLQLGSLGLYLAVVVAWLGWLMLAARRTPGTPPPVVAWYLLVGTLAQLALYPRADTVHALFAGAPLLPIGAWALARVHHRLAAGIPRPGQVAVFAALLLVPGAAILPRAYGQYLRLAHPDVGGAATTYEALQLNRAPVLVDTALVEDLRDTIAYIQQGTTAGEPFFAYPVDPGANVLADRPNPTRFDHFMPGALTRDDMQQVIANLEEARPRYILWDHAAVVYWETDLPNRPLSDYIWRCYRQVAAFRWFLILERSGC